jgi:FAD binding domain
MRSPLDVQALRATFQGDLLTPDHSGYNDGCRLWNASVNKRPALIARCAGLADIIAAVDFARTNDLLTAVRGGGHNVGGRALCDDGLVIDLSHMRAVHVDSTKRTVRVQGGATLGDLDRETHAFGLAVPCGVVPKTGIGGLTLGGGVGWLIRKYGMSIDNLLSCQVVAADGTVRTASGSENDDLFWALRGGGGNFGVVASFEFQAHPVRTVLGGLLLYPREAAVEVIGHFRSYMEAAPDELTAYAALLHGPDGAPLVGVIPCYCGEHVQGERILAPLRKFGTPVVDTVQEMPFPAMQALLAPSFPDGNHNYWKSTLQRDLSDAAISAIVDQANRMKSPLSAIVIEYYGGAAGRVPADATAFPHRDLPWDVLFIAQWTEPAEAMTHREWARAGEESLRQFSANAHLLSALDVEPEDVIDSAFGPNLPRLAAIKAKYDPVDSGPRSNAMNDRRDHAARATIADDRQRQGIDLGTMETWRIAERDRTGDRPRAWSGLPRCAGPGRCPTSASHPFSAGPDAQ